MRRSIGVFAAALAVFGCQKNPTPEQMQAQQKAQMQQDTQSLQQAATGIRQRWAAWTDAGQADSFPLAFTAQGRELPPNAPMVTGPDGIRGFHQQFASFGTTTIDIHADAVMANGDMGIERGTFTSTLKASPSAPPGIPAADTGKYMIQWQRSNGQWLMSTLIWNSDLPIPVPHPAAPKKKR